MKGVYVLTVWLPRNVKKKVGGLGEVFFEKGLYAYVGSAQNNVFKRVERHLSSDKKLHWHVDHLLSSDLSSIPGVYYKAGSKKDECEIAQKLVGVPVKGFGCSDCKCDSHLFLINSPKQIKSLGLKDLYELQK